MEPVFLKEKTALTGKENRINNIFSLFESPLLLNRLSLGLCDTGKVHYQQRCILKILLTLYLIGQFWAILI